MVDILEVLGTGVPQRRSVDVPSAAATLSVVCARVWNGMLTGGSWPKSRWPSPMVVEDERPAGEQAAMASKPPPPSPAHILRTHTAPVRVLAFSDDNERLYSGDAEGTVVITHTRSLRPLAVWKAHSDGLLGVREWGGQIITYSFLSYKERVYTNITTDTVETTSCTYGSVSWRPQRPWAPLQPRSACRHPAYATRWT